MDLSWIIHPLTMYGAVAAGAIASLSLAAAIKMELAVERRRRDAESENLRRLLDELSGRYDELARQARERAAIPARAPADGLNIDKRSEAMRMYRRGCDARSVATALNLPAAEVALLGKVHRILAGEMAMQTDQGR